jgi:hypothetical protein
MHQGRHLLQRFDSSASQGFGDEVRFEFSMGQDKDIIFNACPDSENPVVFEIRRVKGKALTKQSRKHH